MVRPLSGTRESMENLLLGLTQEHLESQPRLLCSLKMTSPWAGFLYFLVIKIV